MTVEQPAAILWDMDGTIVNTEPAWVRAERELLAEWGAALRPQDLDDWVGIGLWDLAAVFQSRGVEMGADEIVDWLSRSVDRELFSSELDWMPGARELAAGFIAIGIPNVMVTMATRAQASAVIARLPEGTFSGLIAGDDARKPKPFPDPYEQGAALLGVTPNRCIAIEDSPTGATAALRSGAFVLGVPGIVSLSDTPVHHLTPSLTHVSAEKLVTLFQTKGKHD